MPRRALSSATPTRASSEAKRLSVLDPSPDSPYSSNLRTLRTNWKWAAFSQFFYTFAPLLSMQDVSLLNVEDDLAMSTSIYIPRVIQRLLYTLTQDRKINLDNWQSSLRKQYFKRSPDSNPLGPEPVSPPEPEEYEEQPQDPPLHALPTTAQQDGDHPSSRPSPSPNALTQSPQGDPSDSEPPAVKQESSPEPPQDVHQTRDWFDLSLLQKLDSLHLLTEWQFQNPHRLRSLMKDDDDAANWRIEPIGYDAKTNAYWLIGPDRLWLQKVPPKPPRAPKRKRQPAPRKVNGTKPSTSKLADEDPEEDLPEERSVKRKRTQPKKKARTRSALLQESNQAEKGTRSRAAKVQANKKLDAQAKELAEFQRQTAAQAVVTRKQTDGRRRQVAVSPRKTVLGTRTSARLRGSDNTEDDEWQPIPAEWLEETVEARDAPNRGRATRSRTRDKGKAKEIVPPGGDEDEDEKEARESSAPPQLAAVNDDDFSDLTELSDAESEVGSAVEDPPDPPVQKRAPGRPSRLPNGKAKHQTVDEHQTSTLNGAEAIAENALTLPDGFIEWETICITLHDWEHISERFENAAHYLEKALYKVLSKTVVPAVTADLREVERKRKLEEAIVHRKRSSRIAIKESEKEEARMHAKKKAEEEEKLARTRRLEARAKKEEAERAKREQAREQRRQEREEREQRALMKEEKKQRARDADRDVSSSAPTVSAAPSPGPSHLVQSTPSSGAKTPDWILDCEVCGKRGANLDDGLPMVSCGLCSRWQHITCYDHLDRSAGRPRRNWEYQQFFCHRCRSQSMGSAPQPRQYAMEDRQHASLYPQKTHVPYQQQSYYSQSTSHLRGPQSFTPESDLYQTPHYSRSTNLPQGSSFSRSQYPQTQSIYGRYQLDQRNFAAQPTQLPPPSPALNVGFPHRLDTGSGQPPRAPQSHQYVASYANGVDSVKSISSRSPPYLPSSFSQPSVRDAYLVSDARHSTSREVGQLNGSGSEGQNSYANQSSYMHNGSWRYPGQHDTLRDGLELQPHHPSDRPVQFYRT